jgi:hypothetical protein
VARCDAILTRSVSASVGNKNRRADSLPTKKRRFFDRCHTDNFLRQTLSATVGNQSLPETVAGISPLAPRRSGPCQKPHRALPRSLWVKWRTQAGLRILDPLATLGSAAQRKILANGEEDAPGLAQPSPLASTTKQRRRNSKARPSEQTKSAPAGLVRLAPVTSWQKLSQRIAASFQKRVQPIAPARLLCPGVRNRATRT